MKNVFSTLLIIGSLLAKAQDPIAVKSEYLSRTIQSFIYDADPEISDKPVVYVTDGKKFINNGSLDKIKKLTASGKIRPAFYVFTSTIDPSSGKDHRNEYFFTNPSYIDFFEKELIPAIEKNMNGMKPEKRTLIGISFGGLNAAYFSAKSTHFKNFGVLSPITYPRKKVYQDISFSQNKNLKIYISSGKNDAETYTQDLVELYREKDYQLDVRYTEGAHDFDNWNSQLAQMLQFLLK